MVARLAPLSLAPLPLPANPFGLRYYSLHAGIASITIRHGHSEGWGHYSSTSATSGY
jgi:hypothetical protein